MGIEELTAAIKRIKQQDGELLTNCFEAPASFIGCCDIHETDRSLLIIKHEYKADRLYFYTTDADDLMMSAQTLKPGTYYLDILSKTPGYMKTDLEMGGFRCIGEMMRLSCRDISQVLQSDSPEMHFFDSTVGQPAELSDAEEIYELLWSVFDTGISHLPDINELSESISDRQFYLYKENGRITALLQEKVQPKRFYINQIYNGSEKRIIHAMLLNRLSEYTEHDGKYAFCWVDQNNPASVKFHGKFGFVHDGLWDIVYQLDKK